MKNNQDRVSCQLNVHFIVMIDKKNHL